MATLSMCRICLAEDVRMHSIRDTPLQEIYESLTKKKLKAKDRKPAQACYICTARLQNCHQLRESCLRGEALLTQMLRSKTFKPNELQGNPSLNTLKIVHPVFSMDTVEELPQDTDKECKKEFTEVPLDVRIEVTDIKVEVTEMTCDIKTEPVDDDDCDQDPLEENYCEIQLSESENNVGVAVVKSEHSDITPSAPVPEPPATVQWHFMDPITSNLKINEQPQTAPGGYISLDPSDIINKPHACDICHKRFSLRPYLNRHKLIHAPQKRYQCSVCNKSFNCKSNLNAHITRSHTSKKPYQCNVCMKSSTCEGDLAH